MIFKALIFFTLCAAGANSFVLTAAHVGMAAQATGSFIKFAGSCYQQQKAILTKVHERRKVQAHIDSELSRLQRTDADHPMFAADLDNVKRMMQVRDHISSDIDGMKGAFNENYCDWPERLGLV